MAAISGVGRQGSGDRDRSHRTRTSYGTYLLRSLLARRALAATAARGAAWWSTARRCAAFGRRTALAFALAESALALLRLLRHVLAGLGGVADQRLWIHHHLVAGLQARPHFGHLLVRKTDLN